MSARHHHFLSQCYLKGFTKGSSKKSRLTVFDIAEGKHFETKPRNVGGIRDFNRIEAEGVDPNLLEKSLSEFESLVATALKKVDEGAEFAGEERELILHLIGLLAVRSPQMREHMRKFHAEIAERMMDLTLASKERWELQLQQMRDKGEDFPDVTYEKVKEFFDSKAYTIEVERERHIANEMVMLQAIVPALINRNWLLIRSTSESGAFITTDRPVILGWNDPSSIPLFYRNSPGFGMKDTYLYFPISKNTALLGEFEGKEGSVDGIPMGVAMLNSRMLHSVYRQVYAPNLGFSFLGKDGDILSGKRLSREIGA